MGTGPAVWGAGRGPGEERELRPIPPGGGGDFNSTMPGCVC